MSDWSFEQTFPDLAAEVAKWESENPANRPTLTTNGEQAQVTDEQIQAYFASRLGNRAPLNPAVSGQTPPPTPEFYGRGRTALPPREATVEEPDVSIPPSPGGQLYPPEPPPEGEEPPSQPTPTADGTVDIDGMRIPIARAKAWAELGQRYEQDAYLRNMINGYAASGQAAAPPVAYEQPQAPPPAPTEYVPTTDDLQDPAVRAMWDQVQQQRDVIRRIDERSQAAEQRQVAAMTQENAQIIESVVTSFQDKYQLPDELVTKVRAAAGRTGAVNSYMSGMDPVTGDEVVPNVHKAVEKALEIGYWMTPETRSFELKREFQRRNADAERKQKLAGISGSSGSVPRTVPAPQPGTPESEAALMREVKEMMDGTWTGEGA